MTRHRCTPSDLAACIAACGPSEYVTLRHLAWLSERYGRLSVADGDWQAALKVEPVQQSLFGAVAA